MVTITAETYDHRLLLGGIINFDKLKSNPVWQTRLKQEQCVITVEGLNTKCYRRVQAFIGDLAQLQYYEVMRQNVLKEACFIHTSFFVIAAAV